MSHNARNVKCDQPVEGHAVARDYPTVAQDQDCPASARASQIWSGPSPINWGQQHRDYPASLEYGSAFAVPVGGSHPPEDAARMGQAARLGRPPLDPQVAARFGSPYEDSAMPVHRGFAEVRGTLQPPDKPEFWRNLGHNIGETVKHIVAPWTLFNDE